MKDVKKPNSENPSFKNIIDKDRDVLKTYIANKTSRELHSQSLLQFQGNTDELHILLVSQNLLRYVLSVMILYIKL